MFYTLIGIILMILAETLDDSGEDSPREGFRELYVRHAGLHVLPLDAKN